MKFESAPVAPPVLDAGDVHVWWQQTRPEDEVPRMRRGRLDRLLRRVLSHYVGEPPASLRFGREPRGRPFLAHDGAPDFNLSDTRGGTVVAVACGGRLGIDLERVDRVLPHRRLAQRYFAGRERDALASMDEESARRAFLRLWTAKEASCKSTGTGIYGWLSQWQFESDEAAPRLLALPSAAGDASRWHHLRLAPHPDYTAVLACDGYLPRALVFVLDPESA